MQSKNEDRKEKRKDPVSRVLLAAIIALFVIVGISFGKKFLFSLGVRQENENLRKEFTTEEEGKRDIDFAALQEANEDICGWIVLDGTSIDFPIVQGGDNLEYLNKNAYGEPAVYGAIFLDTRNQADFSDPFSLLYGHHMNDGNMFGDIDLYERESFFQNHDSGTLYTPQGAFALQTVAYILTDYQDPYIFTPEQWGEKDNSELYQYITQTGRNRSSDLDLMTEGEENRLLALSTCSTHGEGQRSVLILRYLPHTV